MTNRAELIRCWQRELAQAEGLLGGGTRRLRWFWHMRVRLYRFLISCYGETRVEPERYPETLHRTAPLVDNTADLLGLQPRSAARIRATLKKVAKEKVDAAGPLTQGLRDFDWIRVATFRRSDEAALYCEALQGAVIGSRQRGEGMRRVVLVRRADFDAALQIWADFRAQRLARQPSSLAARRVSRQTAMIAMALIFVNLCGFAVVAASQRWLNGTELSQDAPWIVLVGLIDLTIFTALLIRLFMTPHPVRRITTPN